jgi:hypothetical protein
MFRILTLVLLLAVGAAACGRPGQQVGGGISEEQFLAVNTALRLLPRSAHDIEQRRDSVLEEHSVTEEQLRGFVTARSGQPDELVRIWDEIYHRLVDAERPDSTGEEFEHHGPDDAPEWQEPSPAEPTPWAGREVVERRGRPTPVPVPAPESEFGTDSPDA